MISSLKSFRHEIKYYINFFEYHNLRLRLNKVLQHDKYGDSEGNYHIRSLYFDDTKSSALFEQKLLTSLNSGSFLFILPSGYFE